MQRNMVLFIVLSVAMFFLWSTLVVPWIVGQGELEVEVAQGLDADKATIVISRLGRKVSELDPSENQSTSLPSGQYDLELGEDTPEGIGLDPATIEITKDGTSTVKLVKIAIKPKKKHEKPKPDGDPPKNGEKTGDDDPTFPRPPEPRIDPPKEKSKDEPKNKEKAAPAKPRKEPSLIVLGTADPNSNDATHFRHMVYLTDRGAALVRMELNEDVFRDVDDKSGYLGYLALRNAPGTGVIVGNFVGGIGRGTPAQAAGIKAGDTILSIDDKSVDNVAAAREILGETKPGDKISVTLTRDNRKLTVTTDLMRKPLAMMRAEIENSRLRRDEGEEFGIPDQRSFLLTMNQIGEESLEDNYDQNSTIPVKELPGVDLINGIWDIVKQDDSSVTFSKDVLWKHDRQQAYTFTVFKTYRLTEVPDNERDNPDLRAYHIALDIRVETTEKESLPVAYRLDGPSGLPTEGSWYAREGLRDYVTGHYSDGDIDENKISNSSISDEDDTEETINEATGVNPNLKYIGVSARYFSCILLPSEESKDDGWFAKARPMTIGTIDTNDKNRTNLSFRLTSSPYDLVQGSPLEHSFEIFAGPHRPALLDEYGLIEMINYGWAPIAIIAKGMQSVLHMLYSFTHNYGLAVILLTVIVRLGMFPLSKKQALSAQKMQEIQPQIKQINEQYKKNHEQRTKSTQELFRKHNYNPFGGCLLLFIQLPIFFGLYRSLSTDIELRQAALIPGVDWCSNLAAPDMLFNWTGVVPDGVVNGWFLFPALGPYLNVLPIITVGLFILQQKMFTPPPANEQAEMQQKVMKVMMLVIGFMFYKVASGLCVYFIVSSLWGICERKILPKTKKVNADSAEKSKDSTPVRSMTIKPKGSGNSTRKKKSRRKKG